eukprot:COSAG02_NODE_2281_length_9231_cov_15.017959_11_plen_266_part_00
MYSQYTSDPESRPQTQERQRATEGDREEQSHTETESDTERHTERETERESRQRWERHTERDRERHRATHRESDREGAHDLSLQPCNPIAGALLRAPWWQRAPRRRALALLPGLAREAQRRRCEHHLRNSTGRKTGRPPTPVNSTGIEKQGDHSLATAEPLINAQSETQAGSEFNPQQSQNSANLPSNPRENSSDSRVRLEVVCPLYFSVSSTYPIQHGCALPTSRSILPVQFPLADPSLQTKNPGMKKWYYFPIQTAQQCPTLAT